MRLNGWRKRLKSVRVFSADFGPIYRWLPALIPALVIYAWWLPKHDINGWTGEPKEKYYELRGWKKWEVKSKKAKVKSFKSFLILLPFYFLLLPFKKPCRRNSNPRPPCIRNNARRFLFHDLLIFRAWNQKLFAELGRKPWFQAFD